MYSIERKIGCSLDFVLGQIQMSDKHLAEATEQHVGGSGRMYTSDMELSKVDQINKSLFHDLPLLFMLSTLQLCTQRNYL